MAESIVERVGSNRISVQLPGISSEEAVSKIGRTAQLQFMEMAKDPATGEVIVNQADGTTKTFPLDVVLQSETFIRNAKYVPVAVIDKDGVRRELNGSYLNRGDIFISSQHRRPADAELRDERGRRRAAEARPRAACSQPPQPLAFFLDGEPVRDREGNIIAPRVRSEIDEKGVIEGLSRGEASTLSTLLRTGAFPIPLRVVQQDDVDATLGDQAVVYSVQAGLIAILVVMAFMTIYYRLPGVLASVALFVYVTLTLAVFKLWPGHGDLGRHGGLRALGRYGGGRQHPDLRAHEGRAAHRPQPRRRHRRRLQPRLDLDPRRQRLDADYLRHPLLVRRPVRRQRWSRASR